MTCWYDKTVEMLLLYCVLIYSGYEKANHDSSQSAAAMSTHRTNSNKNQMKEGPEEKMTTIIAMKRKVKSEVVEVTRSMWLICVSVLAEAELSRWQSSAGRHSGTEAILEQCVATSETTCSTHLVCCCQYVYSVIWTETFVCTETNGWRNPSAVMIACGAGR